MCPMFVMMPSLLFSAEWCACAVVDFSSRGTAMNSERAPCLRRSTTTTLSSQRGTERLSPGCRKSIDNRTRFHREKFNRPRSPDCHNRPNGSTTVVITVFTLGCLALVQQTTFS